MRKYCIFSIFLFFISASSIFAQVPQSAGFYLAKEYNKEQALYKAKKFVMEDILGTSTELTRFKIDPLASASSGELTSLVYQSDEKNKTGLILGFYGDYWNDAGVVYTGYAFKNLNEQEAIELLNLLERVYEQESKYLNSDNDNNNVFIDFQDMTFLFYKSSGFRMRVFWNGFDSDWESVAFERTKRRFEKKTGN
ncbi:MAG: hypothetical protein HWE07_05105 [Cytophagia bacterium]|nr:hypothetical protein [Cytophagia bacterium]